ncbi:WXG100 family type VII secretion target [Carnobacterium divergens]|uniref:ESAT-6-like protein n=1 Tax=Carnobacterium divergens DSM 20623 TaxID=1449336 RepID=A0A0R2HPP4_CARDV|nr:WXG100 family type VII secretion target [Carnobacterium divergens]AOA00455.1 type VII secretion protein EsxA [Carnobacterium divergens]KRN54850.1 hypothetical protein IV74_GL002441 [Carnobacterium divergens DSM 20623]MDO0874336.1 WXG100 family type VII secretion target [Carnobacterium divergens]MDT1995388.1 WXG100 family type VII secretion target [Carnobacterium divergens]TFI62047.1 WXG100 family type VII secretion target [Carnobacterium divergens]
MSQIRLSPEELRTSAQKYTQGSDEIDSLLSNLKSEQENITQNWGGSASEKFSQQFTELSGKVTEFSQLLRDINRQLNEVATAVEETDREIASKIGFQ